MSAPHQVMECIALEEASSYWRERIRSASSVALFLDFDGTLSPIAPRPELAAIDPQIKSTIERLKRIGGVQIAIISGRQLSDVRSRAEIDGVIYAGNHGLQIETDTLCFQEPRAESLRLELRRLVLRLEQLLSDATGVLIEQKGLGIAVHYRQVHESLHEWVKSSVRDTACRSRVFTCMDGKMVVDVRPSVDWNKGHAVRWILEHNAPPNSFPIYVGDDTTDEDGFSALAGNSVTIRVGHDPDTRAHFWVPNVCAVRNFLASLCELRSPSGRT